MSKNPDSPIAVRLPASHLTRRDVLSAGALAGGALLLGARRGMGQPGTPPPGKDFKFKEQNPARTNEPEPQTPLPPGEPGKDYTPVVVPNGWTLPYKVVDGVKVFHLVAEEVEHEFAPGLRATCWGYNGGVHGPVIEVVEGDRVRIFVTNKLAALTTVHWHGVLLESGMDGVGGLSQKAIAPGQTYMYEFTLRQHGTLMYHSHHDEMTQMGLGMTGMIVVHPRNPTGPRPDRDFALMLHEWKIEVGASRPDPNEMSDFNVLTLNAKNFPGTQPLIVKRRDRVRIRLGNLSAMEHHPIHLHGYYFTVTETDGGVIPEGGRWPETTVLVPVGSTRTVEFVADNPGDWAMHCHMTHHVMSQMGHHLPNMIGVDTRGLDDKVRKLLPDYMTMGQNGMAGMTEMGMAIPPNSIPMVGGVGPYDEITMGGMFTILKVRENLASYDEDPGWYAPPAGTISLPAPDDVLKRNAIEAGGGSAPRAPRAAMKSWELAKPARAGTPGHDGHGAPPQHPGH
jgi:FtsP/CotA-like multicopper oxidase with cupredoxin domain